VNKIEYFIESIGNMLKQSVLKLNDEIKSKQPLDGKDVKYYKSGEIEYKGDFKNGKFEGKGVKYYKSGEIEYVGEFVNNNFEGNGILYYTDKKFSKRGVWVKNKLKKGVIYEYKTNMYCKIKVKNFIKNIDRKYYCGNKIVKFGRYYGEEFFGISISWFGDKFLSADLNGVPITNKDMIESICKSDFSKLKIY